MDNLRFHILLGSISVISGRFERKELEDACNGNPQYVDTRFFATSGN